MNTAQMTDLEKLAVQQAYAWKDLKKQQKELKTTSANNKNYRLISIKIDQLKDLIDVYNDQILSIVGESISKTPNETNI
ncbi:MAG TPA: hypothetical protein VK541_05030 [Pedobacter sp.]|uniref:hypothetical protein n=1 Tax=Pedobacter sp. TaxID=1411316 RepID=UPI002BB488BE|nr:hypothetical protein [Pedobacter sp.]HMI01823.1 hypothetical protein [Pedobacter sp.]